LNKGIFLTLAWLLVVFAFFYTFTCSPITLTSGNENFIITCSAVLERAILFVLIAIFLVLWFYIAKEHEKEKGTLNE